MSGLVRSMVNVVVFVLVLWLNALAGSGALSGDSIGVIANRYPSYFLPANYVFAIWSLIYLALLAFVVYQLIPSRREGPAMEALGWSWPVNGVLNVAWLVLFSFSLFGPAMLVMLGLLANLIWIHVRVADADEPLGLGDRAFVAWTFDLYLAWISVAVIANTFQYVTYVEWGGFGIPGEVWSPVMMVVATALAAFMALMRGVWVFPLVLAWALWGIVDRYAEYAAIVRTGQAMMAVCVGLAAVGVWLGWRRRDDAEDVLSN